MHKLLIAPILLLSGCTCLVQLGGTSTTEIREYIVKPNNSWVGISLEDVSSASKKKTDQNSQPDFTIPVMPGSGLPPVIIPPIKPPVNPVPPVIPPQQTTGNLTYHGRYNGDRATWYGDHNMSAYPETFLLTVTGCAENMVVTNNGTRWEGRGYIVKQSDVTGRGLAVVAPASCKSTIANLTWGK